MVVPIQLPQLGHNASWMAMQEDDDTTGKLDMATWQEVDAAAT